MAIESDNFTAHKILTCMSSTETTLQTVLNGLMKRYQERVPDVAAILSAMVKENVIENVSAIENDHIAFRTLAVPFLGIQSLEKIFLHYGYQKMDHYFFPEKKLDAFWYAPANEKDPRIFISELRVKDLSPEAQRIIHSYTSEVTADPVNPLDLDNGAQVDAFLHNGLWRLPTWDDYHALASESEYAAWAIYNRYYLNHFTISVHNLKEGFNTIEAFNNFLERNGFVLNNAAGKIKRSPDGGLLQSSTVAHVIEAEFANGDLHKIPGSYVEFAERRILPQYSNLSRAEIKRHHRREGFEAANADKIFESTYAAQTSRLK
jgi:hypothetical protein